ncbi:sulfurtransferase TusA family protein [Bacillus daqingensis]|uniref:Sulfurtransferase TusA family protein n=1 Tax=Bacillus daqingensis TaxID=872396 RepID=A0ABV9NTK0_9BACI
MTIKADQTLDAKGLACPMPIVKTKKAIGTMEPGRVLEIQATDEGSLADLKAWSEKGGHQYIGTKRDGDVLIHYVRKSTGEEKEDMTFPHTVSNEELEEKLGADAQIVDVREAAEYSFSHIPGSVSIPLGELDSRLSELDKTKETFVVCRTGNRSDLAAQKLEANDFNQVKNVVPGMSKWNGPVEENE